ncbi:hypothetical protein QBC38DRAFT_152559 [Podospora fimiseda]|uniref:Uncharacterized protein n=1 Tax=Podospora fimiseda TaxID=252190 RepID=A0AAN7H0E0_9PEZI|nr:hypothetical protein QBC38DRAFT_152559 [Podospora fimiseda]
MRAAATVLGLLFLLPIASAFHISGNEIDGALYRVYLNAPGHEVHELATPPIVAADFHYVVDAGQALAPAAVSARGLRSRGILEARIDRRLFCGCNIIMDRSDCDEAVANLKQQITNNGGRVYVPSGLSYYAIRGSVVAFICSPGSNSAVTPVDLPTLSNLYGQITHYCGQYTPGTYKHGTPIASASVDVGYMNSGGNFCATAESSLATKC